MEPFRVNAEQVQLVEERNKLRANDAFQIILMHKIGLNRLNEQRVLI